MTYQKTERFAVAMLSNGMFFGLNEDVSTTSPFFTDHPQYAYHVHPHNQDEPLRPAPYYFENSDRMRSWLEGCKMVWVTQQITAEIEG